MMSFRIRARECCPDSLLVWSHLTICIQTALFLFIYLFIYLFWFSKCALLPSQAAVGGKEFGWIDDFVEMEREIVSEQPGNKTAC